MIRRVVMVVLLALGLSLAHSAPASAAPADDIYALVNEARWANGQAGLIRNSAMDQVAANWAATMAANGTMTHNPDYASQIPGGWSAAAENVAQGHPSGSAMHDGWMGSSGHRANILGNFTDIGIAFLSSGGTTWGVQVFGRYAGHVGPAAPAPPAPPAPPPAPPPPAEPAPVESSAAAPSAGENPSDTTSTLPPGPTTTPTSTPASEREAVTSGPRSRTDGIGPAWWALAAGVTVVAAGTVSTIIRRRRTPS